MSGAVAVLIISLFLHAAVSAQADRQNLSEAEAAFDQSIVEKGSKDAYRSNLLPDAILFKPNAINGIDHLRLTKETGAETLVRRVTDSDVSSNGLLGYTTGDWRLYEKGKSEASAKFGQFVTIWKRNGGDKFAIALDIGITHDKLTFDQTDRSLPGDKGSDPNTRGWSPADASMNFFRISMGSGGLASGYDRFAADGVRLLVEKEPPIIGKKRVMSAMKAYRSIAFPRKVTSFSSGDMAYTWNPCEFDNYGEGTEKGNCVHVWKLRDKKWWIVLGVFARVSKAKAPKLIERRGAQ